MADDGNWWDSSSTRTRYESDQSGASSSSAMATFTSSMGSELVDPDLHLMAWNQTSLREKVNLSCVEQPYDGSSSSKRYSSDNSGVYGSADQDQQSAYQNYGSNNYNYDQLWRQPLQFSNNAPFWNASVGPANDVVFSTQPPPPIFADSKPITKQMNVGEIKKSGNSEAASKRPRNESPLPPFKVRKEKMGDRITALQQLVSPFGKTDTASVLSEAIEYIKFLHEQVTVLSTPYMKTGAPIQHHQDIVDPEEASDLRSRGLCLVPVSSTFPVTHETTVDFWTPSFGGSFSAAKEYYVVGEEDDLKLQGTGHCLSSYSQRHVY